MTRDKLAGIEVSNRRIARIFLDDPVKYAGIQLIWAELWASRHRIELGPEDAQEEPKSLEERQEDYEERRRAKRIHRRRERWKLRRWRYSSRGNLFLNVNGFHIVVFCHRFQWSIRIMDRQNQQAHFSKTAYATDGEATAGAFDALLYMEGKRSLTNLQFVRKDKAA